MLFAVHTFTNCILMVFSASALNGNDADLAKFVQALDHDPFSVTVPDRSLAQVGKNEGLNYLDQHQTNGKGNENIQLENKFQANKNENYEIELNDQPSTEKEKGHKKELKYKPATSMEGKGDTVVRMTLYNQSSINKGKGRAIKCNNQQPIQMQVSQKKEPQSPLKFDDRQKEELQTPKQIQVSEAHEPDLGEGLPLRTQMQTRETASNQGPILGFRKGSKRFSRSLSSYLSKSTSFLGKKLSSRKSKQVTLNLEQHSPNSFMNEVTMSKVTKSAEPQSQSIPLRQETWMPLRKDLESFWLADNIKEIVMIPGSGEFVYDTIIQKRTPMIYQNVPFGPGRSINENNDKRMSDAMLSLDQLKEDLPKVKWVSVVVNWFGNSINIEDCEIYPAVEFGGGFVVTPEDWQVGSITRLNARFISRDDRYRNPRYGGTVSDGALKRYLDELHRRGYKVMLYPMLVFDTEQKEWRGRLTGPPHEIKRFFKEKYNPFIKHYAEIAKETKTEAFIIGSEFVGLTKIQDSQGNYPAVSQLVGLAKEVKTSLGRNSIVTYAADWTEYNIASNGQYPLDELWGSEFIDVVGINAYFPLTDEREPPGGWSVDDIIRGWNAGEGYSYYYNYAKKSPEIMMYDDDFESKWAWNNIEKWWREFHFNPDGTETKWQLKA